ncbi:DUF4352 domain-containing protein [Arthrobacter sp. zg-Y750]|uniref:DUF4352 domain-containing protein n=1 Tax=Arthrobacter sp. zg-Y750 TaxID=2894189 RepID=UPI001E4363FD|nr:DUF4352 domain-containing protein [Arthrobacter sp. zg-Y750]MCC9178503.1 DUF4352 domain-containing protein [Arthrobacter sp. zg-Y750]
MPLFPKRLLLPAAAMALGLSLASCSAGNPGGDSAGGSGGPSAESSADAGDTAQTPSRNTSTQAADIDVNNIGDTVTVPMSKGNVASVTVVAVEEAESVAARSSTTMPEKGFQRVQVIWKTEEGVTDARSTNFTFMDSEGRFNAAEALYIDEGTLWADGVAAGEEVTGYLTFDVEDGPHTLILSDSEREDVAHFKMP